MPGRGHGFGMAETGSTRRHRPATGTPTPAPVPSASFTMTQLPAPDEKRVYQRGTTTGGGQGKGQGSIRLALGSATAGTVGARIRSDDGSTILQPEWNAGTIADGASFVDVAGIDARLGWFFVDIRGIDGNWQLGAVKVGMGALFGFAGQSLSVRLFGRQDGQSATYASLGITPSANGTVLASYQDGNSYLPTVATMPWQTPADMANGTGPNAVGIGEFLTRMIAQTGVNCGAFGHSVGGVSLNTFLSGQAYWTRLNDIITRLGNAFEGFVWGQGHGDSNMGMPPKAYQRGLDAIFAQLTAANSFAGYGKYVWTVPAILSTQWGTPFTHNWVRKGAQDWCTANGGTYVHMYDIAQIDSVHQSQAGSATMGQHIARAMRPQYGGGAGLGPSPLSATRSGPTIMLTLSDAGQTALTLVGTPGNRIFVFSKGRYNNMPTGGAPAAHNDNRFPVSGVTMVDRTTLAIVLANDPGDGHELDLWLYWGCGPANGTTDNVYDDVTSGGYPTGRIVQANFTPVQIAAPVPAGAINSPPAGYVAAVSPFNLVETGATYGVGASGFGQELTGGTALAANGKTPTFTPCTVEGFFTCPALPGSGVIVLFGGFGLNGGYWVGVNSAGKISAGNGVPVGATTLVPGKRYHVAYMMGPSGRAIYLTNITNGLAGVRDYFSAGAITMSLVPPAGGRYALRNLNGTLAPTGGAVDEWAVFASERYAGASYTGPNMPFSGSEPDIVALYRCDGDAKDMVAA